MLSRWPIRYKLLFGVAMLLLIVAILAFSAFRGVYSFRQLTKSVKGRSTELPLAAELTQTVCQLRVTLSQMRRSSHIVPSSVGTSFDPQMLRENFRTDLMAVNEALRRYTEQLDRAEPNDPWIADTRRERQTVEEIQRSLARIESVNREKDWLLGDPQALDNELSELQLLTAELPGYMKQRLFDFADEARTEYRALFALCCVASILTVVMVVALVRHFYNWIFCPLGVLINGSRRVAKGEFDHRITLDAHDEMAELASAMNDMTGRFQEIRDELNQQVKQRTKEIVRSEQLASVGFLAAGVAHEINNPLASIAWAAEALESRLHDLLTAEGHDEASDDVEVLHTYLRRIQEEAFRCKGITENLLDYSRLGDIDKQKTNLPELIESVIDMVRHLGQYRDKTIEFRCDEPVYAPVNAQEIKQVALNLITNGLDSLEPGGNVIVELKKTAGQAELVVTDNGCGMTEDVLEHLFEPFFTRRRDGQGTGLGLSITYRIVADHGGEIQVTSDGPGRGSRFRVTLPLEQHEKAQEQRLQVA